MILRNYGAQISYRRTSIRLLMYNACKLRYNTNLMSDQRRISYKIAVLDEKDREIWIQRQKNPISGTPRIQLGSFNNNLQQIYVNKLEKISIAKLKLLHSNQKAFAHARTIIYACLHLSQKYGYFMINENMVFSNEKQELFAWINPNILDNHVKIYVPLNPQGLKTMIRSILYFICLWIKFDFNKLSQANNFQQLIQKIALLEEIKSNEADCQDFKIKLATGRRGSTNSPIQTEKKPDIKVPVHLQHFLINRRPSKDNTVRNLVNLNSELTASLNSHYSAQCKSKYLNIFMENDMQKNTTTLMSENPQLQEEDIFQDIPNFGGKQLSPINKIDNTKNDKYFPNRTTATKRYGILQMIKKFDIKPNEFIKNNILIDEQNFRESERLRQRKMRQSSFDKIDKDFKDLFLSNILKDQNNDVLIELVEEELQYVLNN